MDNKLHHLFDNQQLHAQKIVAKYSLATLLKKYLLTSESYELGCLPTPYDPQYHPYS
jgi:hypothetical protein